MKKTFLGRNLEFLRQRTGLNQAEMSAALGFERTTYNGYEKNKSLPKVEDLMRIAEYFGTSEAELLHTELVDVNLIVKPESQKKRQNVNLNVNPIVNLTPEKSGIMLSRSVEGPGIHMGVPKLVTVDLSGRENVLFVQVKARAGYLLGYADPEFIHSLPAYAIPGLHHGTFRAFEVDGHSMLTTLYDHDIVIGKWATDADLRDDRVYILVTKTEGILVKRCIFRDSKVVAKSDNNHKGEYPTIVLEISEVAELWYVVQRWTRQLAPPGELFRRVIDLEADIAIIKQRLSGGEINPD